MLASRFRLGILIALAALGGCAQRSHRASLPPALPPVKAAMERQVANAVDAGDGELLLASLRQAVAIHPRDTAARLKLAGWYEQAGFFDLALDHVRMARLIDPSSQNLALAESRLLDALSLPGEAAANLAGFLAVHPGDATGHSWMGIYADRDGDYPLAEKAHRAALALAPDDDRLHNNLGYNLLLQKKYVEAEGAFRQALLLAPNSNVARNNLAIALASQPSDQGRKRAVEQWERLGGAAAVHNNMAAVLIERGRWAEAREEIGRALAMEPGYQPALMNLRLVSQLDGLPATYQAGAVAPGFWQRVAGTFKTIFVGTREQAAADRTPGLNR